MTSVSSTVQAPDAAGPAIAIILARAGSKGVPGKNAALVGGRPCIDWTIDAASGSRTLRQTLVSTDCPVVRGRALERGLRVVDRPADLAGDVATVDAAARHAVLALEEDAAGAPLAPGTPIVILYANVPLRPERLIDDAVELLIRSGADSVQSYAPVGKHHPWWTCVVEPGDGSVRPFDGHPGDPLFHNTFRRQSLPPAHVPDGGVTVVTRRALMLELPDAPTGPHAFLGPPAARRGILTPEGAVVDIDSPVDLIVADVMLRAQRGSAQPDGACGAAQRPCGACRRRAASLDGRVVPMDGLGRSGGSSKGVALENR